MRSKSKLETRESKLARKGAGSGSTVEGPETLPLLVEIGCEEIPARFLREAELQFGEQIRLYALSSRLLAGPDGRPIYRREEATQCPLVTFSTPRRLVAYLPAILSGQPDVVQCVEGPPVNVAVSADGKYTQAAESFAARKGAKLSDLKRIATAKGERIALEKREVGRPAIEVLGKLLGVLLWNMNFAKTMYWEKTSGAKFRFVRPIRWILALLGKGKHARVIRFEVPEVKSGNRTYGHRLMGSRSISVTGFSDFDTKLHKAKVEIDSKKRRETVRSECKVLLEQAKCRVVSDPSLEDWIVNSTEWPKGLVGGFDERFLKLPREILITVMRDHQKYFAVEDREGKLQPLFLTVLNVDGDPRGLIRAGHERVLAARFSDAEFFWNADQKRPLAGRPSDLEGVTYQAELGNYREKVRRMKNLAREICGLLKGRAEAVDEAACLDVERAVELSKCDLTTQMVGEFPELQGVVGGLYARAQGEPEPVSEAIYDHYLPQRLEDPCPRSVVGAVVSLADKLDSVVGGFAVGLEPTGSSDPFAVRRAGNGIIKVLVELSLPIPVRPLVEKAINQLNVKWTKPQVEIFSSVASFLEDRLRYYLESARGFRYDTVRAVLAAGWETPVDALKRAQALEKVRDTPDFEALSVAAKRIKNILSKSASAADWQPGEVDAARLEAREEKALHKALSDVLGAVEEHRAEAGYEPALQRIARLRPAVDRFFDKVLVMAEDRAVRENRLRLLGKLDQLFSGVADFAEIAPAPQNVGAPTKVKVVSEK